MAGNSTYLFPDAVDNGLTHLPTVWGKPVNPLGEISSTEYLMLAKNDEDLRERYAGLRILFIQDFAALCIFANNTYYAARIVLHRRDSLPGWCCSLQALTGFIGASNLVSSYLTIHSRCRTNIMVMCFGHVVSNLCVGVLMTSKAYLARGRDRRAVIIGTMFMIPEFAIGIADWASSYYTYTPADNCTIVYPDYFPYLRFGLSLPFNIVMAALFLPVVVRQHRLNGNDAWKTLKQDGLIYVIAVVLLNIAYLVILTFQLLGAASVVALMLNWFATSSIFTYQHQPGRFKSSFEPARRRRVR